MRIGFSMVKFADIMRVMYVMPSDIMWFFDG